MIENTISISGSMKSAFRLWKKHFVKIAVAGFIVYLPTQICIELASWLLDKVLSYESIRDIQFANNIYNVIRGLVGAVALIGIINFIVRILENKGEQEIGEIVLHGLKKWPAYIFAMLIAGCKVIVYLLLLIIPGIYKAVRLSFVDCVVATENDSVDEWDESERLVENYWWKVFGFILLMTLLRFLVELPFLPITFLFSESNALLNSLSSLIIGIITQILLTYFIVVRAHYYFNLRKIKSNKSELNEEQQE